MTHTRHPLPEIRRKKVDKVIVYVNTDRVLKSGIPLYISPRGTVATPGNLYGVLPPYLFDSVDVLKIRMKRVIYQRHGGDMRRGQEELPLERPGRWREWRGDRPGSPPNNSLRVRPSESAIRSDG